MFKQPTGIAMDSQGRAFVADYGNRLRIVTTAGATVTLAGSGAAAWADGVGTAVSFNNPSGVVLSSAGLLYVSEYGGHRIRTVTTSGIVSTLAGSGAKSFADGMGAVAMFNNPMGMDFDLAGTNIYIADHWNHRIRVMTSARLVTTFAGSGSALWADGTGSMASFYSPSDVCVDSNGYLYVADYNNNRVRKVTMAGAVTTIAGSSAGAANDGKGTAASFYRPYGIIVDAFGSVYVADSTNNKIRQISSSGLVTTLAGSGGGLWMDGTGTLASFNLPTYLLMDPNGNIYVGDQNNNRIRIMYSKGEFPLLYNRT